MILWIILILLVLWFLGLIGRIGGDPIHPLLVIVVVLFLVRLAAKQQSPALAHFVRRYEDRRQQKPARAPELIPIHYVDSLDSR
jgi:4-hydroxybenzoate polyprenyltransferase